jgi:RNA polymerase sigma-70 factor (ECF subfamily)
MRLSESEIIAGCLQKKRKAQRALYDQYHPVLLGICLRYAKSSAEAEDVLLMALTRIYRKIDTYSGDGSFEGWMKRIVINIAIDNYRKNFKHYFHDDLEGITQSDLGFDFIPDSFSVKDILKTVQELPDGYRIVFNLFAIEGYSHKEIAQQLGITESTSKTQLLKARKKLQQKLIRYELVDDKSGAEKKIKIEWGRAL